MKNLKILKTEKLLILLSFLSFLVTSFNVNSTCMYFAHQDNIPEKAKKLRKF